MRSPSPSPSWRSGPWRGSSTPPAILSRLYYYDKSKTLDQTTQYRKTNHWPILLKLWRSSFLFFKDSSNRKPATVCNPYMIGHVANELRHHKFREDRMVESVPVGRSLVARGASRFCQGVRVLQQRVGVQAGLKKYFILLVCQLYFNQLIDLARGPEYYRRGSVFRLHWSSILFC